MVALEIGLSFSRCGIQDKRWDGDNSPCSIPGRASCSGMGMLGQPSSSSPLFPSQAQPLQP